MFNFNELSKLPKYKIIDIIGLSTPKGNKMAYTEQEYNNVITGGVLGLASTVLSIICSILLAIGILSLFGDISGTNIKFTTTIDITILIVCGYTIYNKGKAHNSWVEFIFMLIAIFRVLGGIIGFAISLVPILVAPIIALLFAVISILQMVGWLFIFKGYIDFSYRTRLEYNKNHMVVPTGIMETEANQVVNNQIVNSQQTTQFVDNSFESQIPKYPDREPVTTFVPDPPCKNCGNPIPRDSQFCKTCGAKVE